MQHGDLSVDNGLLRLGAALLRLVMEPVAGSWSSWGWYTRDVPVGDVLGEEDLVIGDAGNRSRSLSSLCQLFDRCKGCWCRSGRRRSSNFLLYREMYLGDQKLDASYARKDLG